MRISSSGGTLAVNTGSEVIVFVPKVQTVGASGSVAAASDVRSNKNSGKSEAGNDARLSLLSFRIP